MDCGPNSAHCCLYKWSFIGSQPRVPCVCFVVQHTCPRQRKFTIWPFTENTCRPCWVMNLSLTYWQCFEYIPSSSAGDTKVRESRRPFLPSQDPSRARTDVARPLVNKVRHQLWSVRRRGALGCLDEWSDLVRGLSVSSALSWRINRCHLEGDCWQNVQGEATGCLQLLWQERVWSREETGVGIKV